MDMVIKTISVQNASSESHQAAHSTLPSYPSHYSMQALLITHRQTHVEFSEIRNVWRRSGFSPGFACLYVCRWVNIGAGPRRPPLVWAKTPVAEFTDPGSCLLLAYEHWQVVRHEPPAFLRRTEWDGKHLAQRESWSLLSCLSSLLIQESLADGAGVQPSLTNQHCESQHCAATTREPSPWQSASYEDRIEGLALKANGKQTDFPFWEKLDFPVAVFVDVVGCCVGKFRRKTQLTK